MMKKTKLAIVLLGAALSIMTLSPSRLAAQGLFGTISGVVTDATGAVVTGATVRVTNVDTNVTTTWKTNGAGVYNATSLNPGNYKIEAEGRGFKKVVTNNILLEVNATPKVDLTLSVGQISEQVEVSAANTPILQTQQTDLGQTLNSRELQQLPTQSGSGRSPYNFLTLAPGVSQQTGCSGCGNEGNVRI